MQISPVTLRVAKAFISRHHRHNKPPVGHKFSIGLRNDAGELIGVATAGRPVARHLDDGLTLEVNRTCNLVADFFMGSGSTVKAALALGRRAIGVELETGRFEQTVREVQDLIV